MSSHPTTAGHLAPILIVAGLAACGGDGISPPGPPGEIDIVAGNNQDGTVGAAVTIRPQVRIQDSKGTPVPGVSVRFDVIDGGGSVSGDSVVTDGDGLATASSWRLGPIPGANSLRAQALNFPLVTTFNATADPGAPSSIQIVSGGGALTAIVGQQVLPSPSVRIRDPFGNAIPGEVVTWQVSLGGGVVIGGSTQTDDEGRATVGGWQLGPNQGPNALQARTTNGIVATFNANSIGIPSILEAASPTDQVGFSSFPVLEVPRVRVKDAQGEVVVGIPVVFKMISGSGTIVDDTTNTDSDGIAALGDWRLDELGMSTIEALVPGFPGPRVEFTASGVVSQYTIDLRFIGTPPPNLRDDFVAAAKRWMEIITADVPALSVVLSPNDSRCGNPQFPGMNESVDDLVIYAAITTIDGPGGVLGSAGPCAGTRRPGTFISAVGTMTFDVSDAEAFHQTDRFFAIAAHEIGHVLGLGTAWQAAGFNSNPCGALPVYTGPLAVAQWPLLGITYTGTPIPLEDEGGCNAGTQDVHWDEDIVGTELMTGFIEGVGTAMPLSVITIGSLADLGYQVDLTKADPFVANLLAAPAGPKQRLNVILLGGDVVMNADGSTTRIR